MPFARLARLQDLAVLERRRELEESCAETDRCEAATVTLGRDVDHAEQAYAEVHAEGRMCLSRMTVAAAVVAASADALGDGERALDTARAGENDASAAWQPARHRADWFAQRDRDQRRAARARRDDRGETEARGLRLALAQGGNP